MGGVHLLPFVSPELFAQDVTSSAFNETQAGYLGAVLEEGGLSDLASILRSSRELRTLPPAARRELRALVAGLARRDEPRLRRVLAARQPWRRNDRLVESRFAPFSPALVAQALAKQQASHPQTLELTSPHRGSRAPRTRPVSLSAKPSLRRAEIDKLVEAAWSDDVSLSWQAFQRFGEFAKLGYRDAAICLANVILEKRFFGEPLMALQRAAMQHPVALLELCELVKRARDPEARLSFVSAVGGASYRLEAIIEKAVRDPLAVEALAAVVDVDSSFDFGIVDALQELNISHHAARAPKDGASLRALGEAARFGNEAARAAIERLARGGDVHAQSILERLVDREERIRVSPIIGHFRELGDGMHLFQPNPEATDAWVRGQLSAASIEFPPEALQGGVFDVAIYVRAAEQRPELFRPLIDLDYALRQEGKPSLIPDFLRSCRVDALARAALEGDRNAFMNLLTIAIRYENEAAMTASADILVRNLSELQHDPPLLKAIQFVRVERLIARARQNSRPAMELLAALANAGNKAAAAFFIRSTPTQGA